ncbi:MAG: hypothetical protein HYR62_01435 [Actinobacteria bacterium]|nr:hypothetical protein [Actinomycetota bacterium]MBI3688838.1 hypothetical protein [Actinomycetota bacterium]
MSTTTRARTFAGTAAEQGKVVLEEARKPLYAVVGAGDWAVAALRELPADARSVVDARVRKAQAVLTELRSDVASTLAEARHRVGRAPARVSPLTPGELRSTVEGYLDRARQAYDGLAARGEKLVTSGDGPAAKTVVGTQPSRFERAGDEPRPAAAKATTTSSAGKARPARPTTRKATSSKPAGS